MANDKPTNYSDKLIPYRGKLPVCGKDIFIAPSADVIGDVTLGNNVNIWFGAAIRGDVAWIKIGDNSNVQDNATVHVTRVTGPTTIGCGVTIGHNAVIHACTIEDNCLIGMGAIILDDAVIGEGSLIGAGAVVTPGTKIPPRSLAVGSPAKVIRTIDDKQYEKIKDNGVHYVKLAAEYIECYAASAKNEQ